MFLLVLVQSLAFAQSALNGSMDLHSICSEKPLEQPLIVIDNGFCQHYLESEAESLHKETLSHLENLNPSPGKCIGSKVGSGLPELKKNSDRWKIRFYASHSFTQYFNSDINFKSTRYNLEVKDYQWAERSSREFFNPKTWKEKGNNPAQMIDEPTNTFTISIEKNGNEFFLSAFHPKFLQAQHQVNYMKGTIDGVAVDGYQSLDTPFHGSYSMQPGESGLVRNQNTHKEMIFEAGYGHRFKLLELPKLGSIVYVPSVGAGVVVGENLTVVRTKDTYWDFAESRDHYGVQGVGGSITNRLEINSPKERIGFFYENKLGYYKMEHGFLDGTQKYNLGFMGNSVGMKFMIYNPKNHPSKPVSP